MMIAFEGIPARRVRAQSRYWRTVVVVVAFLVAIVAAVLISMNNPASSLSHRSVLACGSSPGPCLISSKLPIQKGDLNLDV
jgi:hypothetical protein